LALHTLPYLVNCSIMFTELPLLERASAAKEAGFDAVEFWWPFSTPTPGDGEVDAFVRSVEDAGTRLVALNFFAGNMAAGDAGVLSIPGRAQDFRDNIAVTVGIGARLGAIGFNAPYGLRVEGVSPEEQDELATESLVFAAHAASEIGAVVLVEPTSGPGRVVRTAADGAAVVERVRAAGGEAVGLLCDLYHLAANGDDIDRAIDCYTALVAHVQIADHPGRGEPGSGQVELARYLVALQDHGYDGWVSLEYQPTSTTIESLSWLPRERRGAGGSVARS
jgi:hydroxypyruvate isomerase